jgi:type IV pilus assembly protein PilY1
MVFDMQRPITSEGSIATDDYNHLWVYFGSGRFFSEIDEGDYTTQYYIGIREDTTRATTVAGLLDVTDIQVDVNQVVHYGNGATSTFDVLIDTVNVIGGWCHKMEGLGERNLTTSLVFGGAVLFTSFLPTGDICSYGGRGNLYALFYRTGTAYIKPFLKLRETSSYHPTSVDLGQGMPSEPSLYVSADQTKVFIQAGGGIVSPETGIPGLPKSGVIIWKGR